MRIPHTVPTVAFEAFRCSEETKLRATELERKLRAEDEDWDAEEVADLKTLSLRVIAANWLGRPFDLETLPSAEDRDHMLELLPLDLPFELAVTRLPYEHYWRRVSEARWKYLDASSHGGSWLRLYCERHLSEHLERVEPRYFEPSRERELRLLELLRPHVRALRLRQLLPLRQQKVDVTVEEDDDEEEATSSEIREFEHDHVPMDVILEQLPDIQEIAMSMGMIYALVGPEWQDFEFSVDDSLRLGRGAGDLRHLAKFSLTRSSLNRARAAALLRGLAASRSLRKLDLSHCKLADEGAQAVGGYLSELRAPEQPLRCLRLTNNNVGAEGLAGLVRGLLAGRCKLERLDLRLNPIGERGGAKHLAALLLRYRALEDLNVSGCSLGAEAGMSLAEVLASGRLASTRLRLDCSNNELGPLVGEAFEIAAQACGQLVDVDARMCGFSRESEFAVGECVNRNRSNLTRRKQQPQQPEARRSSSSSSGGGSEEAAATTTDDDVDDERPETLIIPSEYEIFQRRRPAQNLAPVASISLTTISSVISAEGEGEAEDEESDEEEISP